ncbi:MAG: DNA polymerase III subunit delta [Clostridia bacterium]
MTIENLEKELKQGILHSVYLFYGEETFLLETCLKKLRSLFGNLTLGINDIRIEDGNVDALISNIETPAFGYEKKLIVARNTGLFKKEGKRKNVTGNEMMEKLANYIAENGKTIQDSVVLVLVEEAVEKNKLWEVLEKQAIICHFEALKPMQIIGRLKAICKAYGVQVEENVLSYLIESCGTNMQDLMNELRKLIEYVGSGGMITKQEIDKLCIKQLDSVIFDLTDNLGKKNVRQALEVLHNLLYAKEPIQKILITLYHHFKKIYIVKMAIRENRNIAECLNLKPNQAFLTGKYKMQANFFEEKELKGILQALIDLDSHSKIGLIDVTIGLEAILCRYCS